MKHTLSHAITGTLFTGAFLLVATAASAQNLFESELYTGAINELSSSGAASPFVSSTESDAGQIAFNTSGYLFVGNNSGSSITEISPTGHATSFGSGFSIGVGVAVDTAGDVFVANEGNGTISKVAANGTQTVLSQGLNQPDALTIYNGNLYEADYGSGDVYEIGATGTKTLYASGFQDPSGLAFNSQGDLYVANALSDYNGYISEKTSSGTSTILSGLFDPQGIAIDGSGNVFIAISGSVAEDINGYVEEITSSGSKVFSTQVSTPSGLAFAPVPEPSTLALLAAGASSVMFLRRKQSSVKQPRR